MPLCTILVKWPAPLGPQCSQPVSGAGRERAQEGLDALHCLDGAADHQSVAVHEAPDAARDSGIHVLQAERRQFGGPPHAVAVPGIRPVHHDVARRQQFAQLREGRLGRRAGRQHQPEDAGRRKRLHERGQRLGHGHPRFARDAGARARGTVPGGHLEPRPGDAPGHVPAHAAESDHADAMCHALPLKACVRLAGWWLGKRARTRGGCACEKPSHDTEFHVFPTGGHRGITNAAGARRSGPTRDPDETSDRKWMYAFENGDGRNKMLLGGKGANLCEMTRSGSTSRPAS